ncbi:MAG TPA: hypothetical protein VGN37_16665 [Actinocatenispora sp.]
MRIRNLIMPFAARRWISALTVLAATVVALVMVTSTPAEAYETPVNLSCSTSPAGAVGDIYIKGWTTATSGLLLDMSLWDNVDDGHHVAIRFLSSNKYDAVHAWPWHHYYGGMDGPGLTYETTAYDSAGIYDLGVQVEVWEGSTELQSCTDWYSDY